MSKTKIEDYNAVLKVMNTYIDGCGKGDAGLLRQAFHEKAMMTGFLNGDLFMGSIEGFYSIAAEYGPAGEGYKAQADIIALEETVAVAHVAMEDWHGCNFSDYHQLLKENGQWKIISKEYHQFL